MRRAFVVLCWTVYASSLGDPARADVPEEAAARASEIAAILARDPVEVRDLVRLADLSSLEIGAARDAATEARGAARQAGAFPNPRLELDVEHVPEGGAIDDGERKIGVTLPLAWLGRWNRAAAANSEYESRRHGAAALRVEVHRRVRELAAATIRLRDALAARDELEAQARRVEDIARLRAEARAEPRSSALKAEIERTGVESETAALEADLAAAAARLGAALGGVDVPIERLRADPTSTASSWTPESWRVDVAARHPRVLAARAALDAAERAAGAARRAWVPEPELRVAWGRGPSDERFVEAGASLPIPLFDRRRGEAAAARAAAARAERQLHDVEAQLDAEAVAAIARRRAARTRLDAHRERALPAAREAMTLAVEGYSAGRLPFLDLLDALRTLAEAQRTDLELTEQRDEAEAALLALTPALPMDDQGEDR